MIFGECHAHVIMDGLNYRQAVNLHKESVQEEVIHRVFREYQKRGVTFVRDGGDSYGVSRRARELAGQYGIDYRTPIFAIHKKGCYGGIVGRGYENLQEYHALVREAREQGADFIKIMTTGIMDFDHEGQITGTPLDQELVCALVEIAHEEGMSVMSHTNGVTGVQIALKAGVDSVEHGNFMDAETVHMLAESNTVWVPTLVTVKNLHGCGRFPDTTIEAIWNKAAENIRLAYRLGAKVATGSDAGAYQVFHGQGIEDEYQAFCQILGDTEDMHDWLARGEAEIRSRFKMTRE